MKPLFITGIGTDVGKTVISALLVEKLKADYWKPIQSGDLHLSDTLKVQSLVSNSITVFHPEAYRLTQPYSPHKSAHLDGLQIDLNNISLPRTDNHLIVEGAGGLMVPLNDDHFVMDLISKFEANVVLVSRNYLGSINHTLLSARVLEAAGVNIKIFVFNGAPDVYTESIIKKHLPNVTHWLHVPDLKVVSKETISHEAQRLTLNGF